METINITALTENPSQIDTISAFIKSMNIKFTIAKKNKVKKQYNPEFVKKIKESEQQFKDGKFSTISLDDIWKND